MATEQIRIGKLVSTGENFYLPAGFMTTLVGHPVLARSVERWLLHFLASDARSSVGIAPSPVLVPPETRFAIEIDDRGIGRVTDLGIPGSPSIVVELELLTAAQAAGITAGTCRNMG